MCRALDNERDCEAVPPRNLGYEHIMRCGWSRVVQFDDPSSCTVRVETERCDAYADVEENIACASPCSDGGGGLYGAFIADEERSELIENPCSGRALRGPVSEDWTRPTAGADTLELRSCSGGSPSLPAGLCACAAAACGR